ncbi:hypothetical protein FRB99_007727 [Tulasnella sp. 403]|nr:hypothetical protein FRB99_007727 [Tulasnella sp. 403]
MKDYSPLFYQGLFNIVDSPVHFRRIPQRPRPRHPNGRSFLNLKPSVYIENLPPPRTAPIPLPQTKSKSSPPVSPTRRALPLPKPAPLASLPDIPIDSPLPSSALSRAPSSRKQQHRKHASLAPSFFSARTNFPNEPSSSASHTDSVLIQSNFLSSFTSENDSMRSRSSVSAAYRRRRRQDALSTLEGRRPQGPGALGASFVPSILQEFDEDDDRVTSPFTLYDDTPPHQRFAHPYRRSHLSFYSVPPSLKSPDDQPAPPIFSAASANTNRPGLLKSPTAQTFSFSFADDSLDTPSTAPRRASTGTSKIGWGINFIDLEDDCASIWRWSHVA